MISKNEEVRNLVAQGEYKKALQICKDWDYADRSDRNILRLGYDCLVHPEFYEQLGREPDVEYQRAIEVLKKVYGRASS